MSLTPVSQSRHLNLANRDFVTPQVGAGDSASLHASRVAQIATATLFHSQQRGGSPKNTGDRIDYRSPSEAGSETPELTQEQNAVLEQAKSFVQRAESFSKEGRVSDAMEALVNRAQMLSKSLPDTLHLAVAYTDLGTAREKSGELDKAITCFERAKPILEKVQSDTTELFKFYGHLALLYESSYKIPQALECYKKCESILESSGVCDTKLASNRDKIANLLEAQGDQSGKALELRLANLPVYSDAYPRTLRLANYYDLVGALSGSKAPQEMYLRKSIEIEKSIDLSSPEISESCQRIRKMYEDRSKLEAAFDQLSKEFEQDSVPGLLSPSYVSFAGVRNSLVKMIDNINKFERSLRKKAEMDAQNPCVGAFSECVADHYAAHEDEKNARTFYRIALTVREKTLGNGHRDVIALSQKISSLPSRLVSMSQARMGSVVMNRAQSVAPQADKLEKLIADLGHYSSGLVFKNSDKDRARDKLKGLLSEYQRTQEESKYAEIAKYVNDELTKTDNPIFAGAHTGNLSMLFVRTSAFFKA